MTRSTSRFGLRALQALALGAGMTGAGATTYSFSALLSGAFEVPAVATPASGFASVLFDDASSTVSVSETWSGLIGGAATASHIHCCNEVPFVGTSAVFQGFTAFPNATSGTYSNTFALGSPSFAILLAGTQTGRAYVNIHNAAYPGGEISGFLVSVVPEPATSPMVFVGLVLGGMWISRRRRAGR